jgi:hypothetical protein
MAAAASRNADRSLIFNLLFFSFIGLLKHSPLVGANFVACCAGNVGEFLAQKILKLQAQLLLRRQSDDLKDGGGGDSGAIAASRGARHVANSPSGIRGAAPLALPAAVLSRARSVSLTTREECPTRHALAISPGRGGW